MLNRITLMGRLTKNPELRLTNSGKAVASFTLAVDRDYTSGADRQTDFVDCVIWNQGAEFVNTHFNKGQMMALSGRLQSRKWEDRDGDKRTAWEVVADNVYFCGDKPKENSNYQDAKPRFEELPDDGEIPF